MLGSDETIYRLYGEQGLEEKRKCGSLGKWIPALEKCVYPNYGSAYIPNAGEIPVPPQQPEPPESAVGTAEDEIQQERKKRSGMGRDEVRVNANGVQQTGTKMGSR